MRIPIKALFALAVLSLLQACTTAAPIWIEQQFIPSANLIDARFQDADEVSEAVVDHAAWQGFLDTYLVEDASGINLVAYDRVTEGDRNTLDTYLDTLKSVDVARLNRDEQLSFWINLYNAETVALILDNYPTSSIRTISKAWRKTVTTVNGLDLSLGDIEHSIIRPVYQDNRIHYAVNCASIGCPNLDRRAYTGGTLQAQLDEAASNYINHPRGVTVADGKVQVSRIYGWYKEDFGSESDILEHIRLFAAPALLEALGGADQIDNYDYDWNLNIAPNAQ